MLITIISSAQQGSQEDMLCLLDKFAPILGKYARMLGYEDAKSDLNLALIRLFSSMRLSALENQSDGAIVNYVAHSIYNTYVKLSQKAWRDRQCVSLEDLPYELSEGANASFSETDKLEALIPGSLLGDWEFKVILLLYQYQYSVSELSQRFGLSRQAVNQTKCRALKKLKAFFQERYR